jgi:hypothetical protein
MAAKYSLLPLGSGFMVLEPGVQPAGHTYTQEHKSVSLKSAASSEHVLHFRMCCWNFINPYGAVGQFLMPGGIGESVCKCIRESMRRICNSHHIGSLSVPTSSGLLCTYWMACGHT